MDFNATIDLIIKDLQEAREIIDDLKKYKGVPFLQVELAKAKCKSAAEVIALLKQEEGPKMKEERRKTEDRRPEEEVLRPKTEDRSPETEVEKTVPVAASRKPQAPSPMPPAQSPEPEKTSLTSDALRPSPLKEENIAEHPVKKPADGGRIGDSFSHLSSRFNEQLGNRKTDDDLSGMMKTKSISSLTEAIGINDRFLFLREIFDGNKDAYTQAITKLENATSITDARAVIMSYTGDNDENEAVKQLLDLVKRKLPSNE